MSYTRRYHVTVSGSKTVSVSYPASQNGGSKSATVTIDIPVDIEIDVNTTPFDSSVRAVQGHVDGLTGAVVATQAAQIVTIKQSSQKIADTVVNGFFNLIRSEISQQISEYKPQVDALTVELIKQQESCRGKQKQMGEDYALITGRYSRIFADLDKEVTNRVKALNSPAFTVEAAINAQVNRCVNDKKVNIATIFNTESNVANNMMFASAVKKRAASLINSATRYLLSEKKLFKGLKEMLFEESSPGPVSKCIPVLYFETSNGGDAPTTSIINNEDAPGAGGNTFKKKIQASFRQLTAGWKQVSADEKSKIETYFINEINKAGLAASQHDKRVTDMMVQMFKNNHFQAPA